MKFRSRNDNDVVRIASTTGHICLIGSEFVELPQHMEAEAYANGCVSEELYNAIKADIAKGILSGAAATGTDKAKVTLPGAGPEAPDKPAIIRAQIEAMLSGAEDGAFTAAGLPNLKVLSSKCGFQVSKEEMEAVWAQISADKGQGE